MEKPSNVKGSVDHRMNSIHSKMITIRNELEIIRRAVTCSICLCTMKEPITLAGCAHSFCYTCIRQSMDEGGKQSKCPLCQLPTTRRSIQKPSNVGANSVRILIASYKQMMRSFGCAPFQYTPSIHTLTQLEPMEEENDSDDDDTGDRVLEGPVPKTSQDVYDQWHVSRAMLQALKDQQQTESKVGTTVVTEQILNEQEQIVQVNEECYLSRHGERDSPKASPMVTSFRPQRQSLGSVHRTPLTQKKLPPSTNSILLEKSPHTLTQILQQAQSQEAANQRTPSPTPEEDNFYSAIDLPPSSVSPMKKLPQHRTSLVPMDDESASSEASSQGVLSATSTRRKSVSEILQQEEEDDHSVDSSASDLPPPAFQAHPNPSRNKSPAAATIAAQEMTTLEDLPSEAKISKSDREDSPNTSSFSKASAPNTVNHTAPQEDREEEVDAPMAVDLEDELCDSDNKDPAIDSPNADVTNPAALQVGDIVQVQARTWPGINQLGGIAKIIKVRSSEEGTLYDVRYVLDRRKECNIQECYVSLHTEIHQATKEDVPKGPRRRSAEASQKENDIAAEAIPPSLRKQLIADGCDLYGTMDTIHALDHFKKSKPVTKRPREPAQRRASPPRKRPHPEPPMPVRTIEEACRAAEDIYRQRIQTALAKGTLYICTSSLSEGDQRALHQMCQVLQKGGPVKIKLLDKVQPNKTTLCVVPCTTTENDERNLTAERRSLKAMSCSLYGIPMVTPAWIKECLQERKIIVPISTMYIRSLPTKTNIPSSYFGVTFLAASMSTINLQEPNHHKGGGKLLQSVGTAVLVGFSNADETNFTSLLRQGGVSEVLVNKHTALSKLKAICKKDAASLKQNKAIQSFPLNRFVIICSDIQNASLSESFVSTVREYYGIPGRNLQSRISCVNIQWLFDSISCGAQLDADTAAPNIHPPNYYYRPINPQAKEIWDMTVHSLDNRSKL